MDRKTLPVGIDSFRELREGNYYYADKSMLIADWLADGAKVTLITRPRRFGKTLNMDMVKEFLDIDADSEAIFDGLAVMDTRWKEQINSRPVIFLSFRNCKDVKPNMMKLLKEEIRREYERFETACMGLSGAKRDEYKKITASLATGNEDWLPINSSIAFLTQAVSLYYGKSPALLIDEYDTPIISALMEEYYDELRPFFTALYATALKSNPYLDRALLMGIQPIAMENTFSELNNFLSCTVAVPQYDRYFGFTAQETSVLLETCGLRLDKDVQAMYDGYRFGNQELYNPWSIINYASEGMLAPYWVNTSSNAIIRKSILEADPAFFRRFEELMETGSTDVSVLLDTSFFELRQNETLWGMLLNAGYITQAGEMDPLSGFCEVRIPNREVKREFQAIVAQYTRIGETSLNEMFHYLVRKPNIPEFVRCYREIVLSVTSFFDARENACHMLMLGMCVYLDRDYEISSNLEAGHGRSDITLKAKRPGGRHVVIEFKQGENLEDLAQEALRQIEEKRYDAGLDGEILLMGIAHQIKDCVIATKTIRR